MAICINCNRESNLISETLRVCLKCIREEFEKLSGHIREVHRKTRRDFGLPEEPPRDSDGVSCKLCANECKIPLGERGYCSLRENINGRLIGPKDTANLTYYHDGLPTNCVAGWVCPGGTGSGYPEFAYKKGPEIGFKNLAVFYIGCSFNCLFCQNWHFRQELKRPPQVTFDELLNAVDNRTSCICYFGGDPAVQLGHSIKFSWGILKNIARGFQRAQSLQTLAMKDFPDSPEEPHYVKKQGVSRRTLESKKDRILRICWETNGSMHPNLLEEILEIALVSGGCIKFDLKTYDEKLSLALCGVTNKRTLENFRLASKYIKKRKMPPLIVASTLLVPGYVDKEEVYNIAKFISNLDSSIPYSLLGFGPNFYMSDLPYTSKRQAKDCLEAAGKAGLLNVHIGNVHLLGRDYE